MRVGRSVGRLGSSRGGVGVGKQAGRQARLPRSRKQGVLRVVVVSARGRLRRGGGRGGERCRAMGGGRDPASAAGKQQEVFANLLLLLPR